MECLMSQLSTYNNNKKRVVDCHTNNQKGSNKHSCYETQALQSQYLLNLLLP